MQRIMIRTKIHRATVTDADLHYEGSLTIDRDLLQTAQSLRRRHQPHHTGDRTALTVRLSGSSTETATGTATPLTRSRGTTEGSTRRRPSA